MDEDVPLSVEVVNHSTVQPLARNSRWSAELDRLLIYGASSVLTVPIRCVVEPNFTIHTGAGYSVILLGLMGDCTAVAIKKSPTSEESINEITMLRGLCHSGIIQYKCSYGRSSDFTYLVMGLEEQTLEERIRNYSLKERIQTLKTFLEGLHYLHQQSIIHGDVKQKHVLVDTNGFAKLIDFKKSKRVENGDVKIQEEIQEAGKVAYYILSGGETYPQSDGDGSWTNKDITLNFIERMTHTDPTKRISLEDALRHPIFWSEIRKMRYLQAVGNFLEVKCHNKDVKWDLIKKSKGKSFVNWRQEVEKDFAELLKDMDKYLKSPYPKDPCGLLQFIRNVYQHRAEVAPSMKFTSRFPDLFDTVYVFAEEMGWNSRHSLQNIFRECERIWRYCLMTSVFYSHSL